MAMAPGDGTTLEELLGNAAWMRRLARQLLGDAGAADVDDAVQDTWVAVARRRPPAHRPVRPWLARVVGNFARMRRRGEDRRRARDGDAATTYRPDDLGAEALLERAQLHHRIAALVMALEEPYRATVLLRFYEERTATEIAHVHGVEAGTVRWRLKVALDRIRAQLDLAPTRDRRVAWIAGGVILMKKKLAVVALALLALALLLGGGALVGSRLATPPPAGPASPGAASAHPPTAPPPPRLQAASGTLPPPSLAGPAPTAASDQAAWLALAARAGTRTVKGRVLDDGAGAIPGARVTAFLDLTAGQPTARLVAVADRQGHYSLTLPPAQYSLWAEADGYTIGARSFALTGDLVADFRLTPEAQLAGRVVDGRTRQPVAGVEVRAFPEDLHGRHHEKVLTDADGAFRVRGLEGGNWIVEARLGRLVGRAAPARVAPLRATGGLEVRLEPMAVLAGRVRDGAGGPLPPGLSVMTARPDTRVSTHTQVAEDGTFRLEGVPPGSYQLTASTGEGHRGFLQVDVGRQDITDLELVIAAPITVDGRVIDAGGAPVAGARVVIRTAGGEAVSWGRGRIEISDSSGGFRTVRLPAGAVTVTASRPGAGSASWGPQPGRPGAHTRVELRLFP
jgi:RNA polymerase sigma factor (sigma-70 family)